MARSIVFFSIAFLIGVSSAVVAADGRVVGAVADESGGLLPGVAVVVTDAGGRVLATTVTDAAGRYDVGQLPAGTVKVAFRLDGFAPGSMDVTIKESAASQVNVRLAIAQQSESLTVVGHVPSAPPAAAPPPPPPPAPPVTPVVEHERDSVCGPAKPSAVADSWGTIRARVSGDDNGVFVTGDQLVVEASQFTGFEIGMNFAVRRPYRAKTSGQPMTGQHTAGVVQVVSVNEPNLVVVVIYACDELMRGVTIGPFRPELRRPAEAAGAPAYDDAARVLFADQGQLLGAPRRLLVIDRGQDHGIRVGQRLTLFRKRAGGAGPTILGDAVVVAVRPDSATIRVERATDIIAPGDGAAPQRAAPVVPTGAF